VEIGKMDTTGLALRLRNRHQLFHTGSVEHDQSPHFCSNTKIDTAFKMLRSNKLNTKDDVHNTPEVYSINCL
jgi:hypothetical protein